jgi:hypothetical protein
MAIIVPSITPISAPIVSVTIPITPVNGVGITYQQFIQSLGTYNYGVEYIYLYTTTFPQLMQPFYYNHFSANGNSASAYLIFTVDSYQSQTSKYYESDPEEIILDNLCSMTYTVLAGLTVDIKMYVLIEYIGNEMDDSGQNNFWDLEQREGVSFFEDYTNYIIEE